MRDPEYYANPGLHLDTDDHERLIEENQEAMIQERLRELDRERERLLQEAGY